MFGSIRAINILMILKIIKIADIAKNIIKIALRISVLSWYSSHFISIEPLLLYNHNPSDNVNNAISEEYTIFNIYFFMIGFVNKVIFLDPFYEFLLRILC